MVEYSACDWYPTEYTPREPRSSDKITRGDFSSHPQRTCSARGKFTSSTLVNHTTRRRGVRELLAAHGLKDRQSEHPDDGRAPILGPEPGLDESPASLGGRPPEKPRRAVVCTRRCCARARGCSGVQMRIADYHTYFVGRSDGASASGAHNACNRLRQNMINNRTVFSKGQQAAHIVPQGAITGRRQKVQQAITTRKKHLLPRALVFMTSRTDSLLRGPQRVPHE